MKGWWIGILLVVAVQAGAAEGDRKPSGEEAGRMWVGIAANRLSQMNYCKVPTEQMKKFREHYMSDAAESINVLYRVNVTRTQLDTWLEEALAKSMKEQLVSDGACPELRTSVKEEVDAY